MLFFQVTLYFFTASRSRSTYKTIKTARLYKQYKPEGIFSGTKQSQIPSPPGGAPSSAEWYCSGRHTPGRKGPLGTLENGRQMTAECSFSRIQAQSPLFPQTCGCSSGSLKGRGSAGCWEKPGGLKNCNQSRLFYKLAQNPRQIMKSPWA